MTNTCNLKYNVDLRQELIGLIKRQRFAKKLPEIIKPIFSEFFGKSSDTLLNFNDLLDDSYIDIYETVNSTIRNLAGVSNGSLPTEWENYRQTILSLLFDMSSETKDSNKKSENEEAETQDEIQERLLTPIEDAAYETYGGQNLLLTQAVNKLFYKELKELLVVNIHTATKHNLNNQLANTIIASYKNSKFKQLLDFLKNQYPEDSRLSKITSMYNGQLINLSDFYYVLDSFKHYLNTISNLEEVLNSQLTDKILQTKKESLQSYYNSIIDIIQNSDMLKSWFDREFKTEYSKKTAANLFIGESFSSAFKKIEDMVSKTLQMEDYEDNEELIAINNLIQEIKKEDLDLLELTNSYFILTQFDNLLNYNLRDYVKIHKDFIVGSESLNKESNKYILQNSHKHQKIGFESGNNESSEKHTSANTKDILEALHVYSYSTRNATPTSLSLTLINTAWQALVQDIMNNGAYFSDSDNKLKNYIASMQHGTINKIFDIFDYLFQEKSPKIDKLVNTNLFNNQTRDVLYSFYFHVLDKTNPNSFINKEADRMNTDKNSYLEIVSDLAAILYRTVSNTYLDCNLISNTIGTQAKFNWDSNLFDLVERITIRSSIMQTSPEISEKLLNNFESTQMQISLNLNGSRVGYTISNSTNRGIFTTENKLKQIIENNVNYLDVLAALNINNFKTKYLNYRKEIQNESDSSKIKNIQKRIFNADEINLLNLLELFELYLDMDILSEMGLNVLAEFKNRHKADPKSKLYSANYLDSLLRNLLRAMEIHSQALKAKGKIKLYLEMDSKARYGALYKLEKNKSTSALFDIQGSNVFFKPVSIQDLGIINWVKTYMLVNGETSKSTIMNKLGSIVPNYTVARAGSKLHQRLYEQSLDINSAAYNLLFVLNPGLLDTDPVVDAEITTPTGEVISVKELTEVELFKHAILDKFYTGFITNDKVCFQPTVYSDKVLFLNYMSRLTFLGKNPLNLYTDNKEKVLKYYKDTFFKAHSKIFGSVLSKFEKFYEFHNGVSLIESETGIDKIKKINNYLKTLTKDKFEELIHIYNEANSEDLLEFELDKDYRIINDRLTLNEVLLEHFELANDEQKLRKYIAKQMLLFLEDLKYYGVSFKVFNSKEDQEKWVKATIDSETGEVNEVLPSYKFNNLLKILSSRKILSVGKSSKQREQYVKEWISDTGELIFNIGDKINPLLEKFFYIEGLLSNNLRLSLSGSEINHPDKAFSLYTKLKNLNDDFIKGKSDITEFKNALILEGIFNEDTDDITFNEFSTRFSNTSMSELKYIDSSEKYKSLLSYIYDNSILEIINVSQGTLFKRNVIVTATAQNPLLGLVEGVSDNVTVAVIEDMKAPVNTLRKSKEIDACDGSAKMSYILMLLENNALGEQKVGTNRKPIWDAQTSDLTSFLAKFASFAITNASMKNFQESTSSDYNLFKKMHNIRWKELIDLTHNIFSGLNVKYDELAISQWFKKTILKNKKLLYTDKFGITKEIRSFGKDELGYFTIESVYTSPVTEKVYHYFDDESNHFTTYKEGLHTIDSLFELFVAMGGINCVDADGNISDFSQEVLTNFVINVGYKKDEKKPVITASDVVQPLKDKFIAYVFNNTAVKNGAKNVNSSQRWTDNNALNTFKVSTAGLGIQLNADHDVVNLELTEFSQVIAACAAYGKTFGFTDELFFGLGQAAFLESKKELDSINNFLYEVTKNPEQARYDLYKIVAQLILKTSSNSEFDLTDQVKIEVNRILKQNRELAGIGEMKIAFSDPSLYNQFITSITSVINKKSIKRKHPGSAYVMVPSYNTVLYYQVYSKDGYKKLLFTDLVEVANTYIKYKLLDNIGKTEEFKNKLLSTIIDYYKVNNIPLPNLVEEGDLDFLLNIEDTAQYNKYLVSLYTNILLKEEPLRLKEWFMPTDKVLVTDINGNQNIYDLSSMEDYYAFKNTEFSPTTTFKLCVTQPVNLKPSLIRWKYKIDRTTGKPVTKETDLKNIEEHYMTIYDHPIIRNSWNKPKNERPKQLEILDVLDELSLGTFTMNGETYSIYDLENIEAELILSNMYSETFDTKNNSLAKILSKGKSFFEELNLKNITDPPKGFHHLTLMKSNGNHVLISLDKTLEEGTNLYGDVFQNLVKKDFDVSKEYVNSDGEIYTKENGVKIGKYILREDWKIQKKKISEEETIEVVLDENNEEVDLSKYKIGESNKIYERINYVDRYYQYNSISVHNHEQTNHYTLYKIANIKDIARSFNQNYSKLTEEELKKLDKNALSQVASIIESLYDQEDYIDVRINKGKVNTKESRLIISNVLQNLGNDYKKVKGKWQKLTEEEINNLPEFEKYILLVRLALLNDDFDDKYTKLYEDHIRNLDMNNKKWVSFLSSLKFISSRIPAQSLQSFMPMKCIGWTGDSNNTAYVSYIQTFLQGSDYDIDKAYIMGQSFNDGVYIGWSNLFDYTSIQTLEASKTLPIPKNLGYIESYGTEYNIDLDIKDILRTQSKATKIHKIAKLIDKINKNNGKYNYTKSFKADALVKRLVKHDKYIPKLNLRTQAYKNASSANIFNIVHDIRNRDLAYSEITMGDLRKSSENSPKGLRTKNLNMVNPLTKYIMLRQNILGKDVIGIAANGEKDWFNITYFYHKVLREGTKKELQYLNMFKTFLRIKGRAKGKPTESTVKHIPDLWHANKELSIKLKQLFYDEGLVEDQDDKYVDLLISQLLSAATDNAKELILAKINAGTNLAKYHLHLMMLGYKLDDIVAFMTSPVVELIDKYSKNDLYDFKTSSVNKAIKILEGDINLSEIIVSLEMDLETALDYQEYLLDAAENEVSIPLYDWIVNKLGTAYTLSKSKSLQDFILKYIKAKLGIFKEDTEFLKDYELPKTDNYNINYLFKYVNSIISNINTEIINYKKVDKDYSIEDFYKDLEEFKDLDKSSQETSTLASVWLKLNLGIPQTDEELIKLIKRMNDSISDREIDFGIHKIIKSTDRFLDDELEDIDKINKENKENKLNYLTNLDAIFLGVVLENAIYKSLFKVVEKIKQNNPSLSDDYIYKVLSLAIKYDLYGNFDLYAFLEDRKIVIPEGDFDSRNGDLVSYREFAQDYYNLIKSTWNILAIVNKVPTYKRNLDLLNYSLTQRRTFANKAEILDKLLNNSGLKNRNLSTKLYKLSMLYVDRIIISSFFFSLKDPINLKNMGEKVKILDSKYNLLEISDYFNINTLDGIDSLKLFFENYLLPWLLSHDKYKNNPLIKDLTISYYFGKRIVRTKLDLSKINSSFANKLRYNEYLRGFLELVKEGKIFGEYSIADLLVLYNLAVNGTKIGSRFLTSVFRNSVVPGSILYKYYKFISSNDYNSFHGYEMPTKTDFLIYIAPIVSSTKSLAYRTEKFVKVRNLVRGFDVYQKTKNGYELYSESYPLDDMKPLSEDEKELRIYNFMNSLNYFPKLNRIMLERSVFDLVQTKLNLSDLQSVLARYIREFRLMIYKNC